MNATTIRTTRYRPYARRVCTRCGVTWHQERITSDMCRDCREVGQWWSK